VELLQFVGYPLDGLISCTNTFEYSLQLQLQLGCNEFSKSVQNDSQRTERDGDVYIRTSHLAILARSAMFSVNTFDGAACVELNDSYRKNDLAFN